MFKDEADFERVVGQLNIDDQPNPAHREKLRRQMLNAFDEASGESAGRASENSARGRTIVIRSLLKFAAAAAILIAAVIGVYQLRKPDKPVVVVKEDRVNPSEAVHIGTPDLAPIELDLPKPMFVGTRQDAWVENLEKPLGRPRPPFMAPLGTRNIAEGKPVSSSDEEPIIGEIEMITDGDKEAADGSYIELGPSTQYVTIDLEAAYDIYAVVVWHYHKEPRVYFDVVVQVADAADFTKNVKTIFNNDIDNSAGLGIGKDKHYTETNEGRLIDAKGLRGRYVRLYSSGNTSNELNHYIEVEVYGKPAQ